MAKVSIAEAPALETQVTAEMAEPKKNWVLDGEELILTLKNRKIVMEELSGLQSMTADRFADVNNALSIATCRTIFAIRQIDTKKYDALKKQVEFNYIAQSLKARELDAATEAYFSAFSDSVDEIKNS